MTELASLEGEEKQGAFLKFLPMYEWAGVMGSDGHKRE